MPRLLLHLVVPLLRVGGSTTVDLQFMIYARYIQIYYRAVGFWSATGDMLPSYALKLVFLVSGNETHQTGRSAHQTCLVPPLPLSPYCTYPFWFVAWSGFGSRRRKHEDQHGYSASYLQPPRWCRWRVSRQCWCWKGLSNAGAGKSSSNAGAGKA